MKILAYNPAINNPFNGNARNPNFLESKFDYSCIGLVHVSPRDKVVTAVGTQEIVAALHYGLVIGQEVSFVNMEGNPIITKISKIIAIHGDIQVSQIEDPWEDLNIKPATIASAAKILAGAQTLVFGETSTSIDIAAFGYVGYKVPATGGEEYLISVHGTNFTLEPGDSGAPDFLVTPNGLILLGIHYSILPTMYLDSLLYPFNY